MPSLRWIAIILGILAVLAIPACLLLSGKPATVPPQTASETPRAASGSADAPRATPAAERLPVVAEPIPAALPDAPPRAAEPAAATDSNPLRRLVDRILPQRAQARSAHDCDIPGDPIGSTLCRMRCHLLDHPDALVERAPVRKPDVRYWLDSNLVINDL